MKKYIKFKLLIFIAFLALTVVSCDENNDPEPIIGTEDYPVATFTISATTVSESGGVVTITINTDKMLKSGITFSAEQIGGTAVLHDDYDITDATMAAYTTEAKIIVTFHDDFVLDEDDTLELQITTPSLANQYLLNPTTVLPTYSLIATNYVATFLDVILSWDMDVLARVPEAMNDAVSVSFSEDDSEYNLEYSLMSNDTIVGEIEFISPNGFAVMSGIDMDFAIPSVPAPFDDVDEDYSLTMGDILDAGSVLTAKAIYTAGTKITTISGVEKGDIFVYKITRLDEDDNTIVSYGYITIGDLALLNGVDPILNFDYIEGVLPEPESTDSYDYIDFDIFVSVAAGFDINDPWANDGDNIVNAAATGDTPETLQFDLTGAEDGEYIIWHDLWWNGYKTLLEDHEADGELVPITATFSRQGIDFSEDVVQDDSQAITSDQIGDYDYDLGDYVSEHYGIIAKLTIANGNYTITDFNDVVIASGKNVKGKVKSKRPLKYKH